MAAGALETGMMPALRGHGAPVSLREPPAQAVSQAAAAAAVLLAAAIWTRTREGMPGPGPRAPPEGGPAPRGMGMPSPAEEGAPPLSPRPRPGRAAMSGTDRGGFVSLHEQRRFRPSPRTEAIWFLFSRASARTQACGLWGPGRYPTLVPAIENRFNHCFGFHVSSESIAASIPHAAALGGSCARTVRLSGVASSDGRGGRDGRGVPSCRISDAAALSSAAPRAHPVSALRGEAQRQR